MSEEAEARHGDPRVRRSRAAAKGAATHLFLRHGYAGATMDGVAKRAGLTKRTLYNNYADKSALFTEVVADVTAFAEKFVSELDDDYFDTVATDPSRTLGDLAQRLASAILRPPVIALRRLLISESAAFPHLAEEYYERAPGAVLNAITSGFTRLKNKGHLRIDDPRLAAEQFAYLVVGARLDRAILTGTLPSQDEVARATKAGVQTFLARYGAKGTM